jgi:hypothetical protein
MTETQLDDLLYTLDICAESLPFDLQPVHVRRLEIVKGILIEHQREQERRTTTPARILSLVDRSRRDDADDRN